MVNGLSHIELPFEKHVQMLTDKLKKHQFGYLATANKDQVWVREIRCVPIGLNVLCFTDIRSRKWKQIEVNPIVALAFGNHKIPYRGIQIEGNGVLRGHPLDENNKDVLEAYKERQPEAYERSMKRHFIPSRPNLGILEIVPRKLIYSVQGDTAAGTYVDIVDLVKKEANWIMANVGEDFSTPAYKD
jgi:general stress protein 26